MPAQPFNTELQWLRGGGGGSEREGENIVIWFLSPSDNINQNKNKMDLRESVVRTSAPQDAFGGRTYERGGSLVFEWWGMI